MNNGQTKRPANSARSSSKKQNHPTNQNPNRPAQRHQGTNLQTNARNSNSQNQRSSAAPRPAKGLSDNLRSQTPLNRQLRQRTTPNVPGTSRRVTAPQQFKVKTDEHKKRNKTRGKSNRKPLLLLVTIIALFLYVIVLPIGILIFNFTVPYGSNLGSSDITFQLGEGNEIFLKKLYDNSKLNIGGIYYIDMDAVADYCSLTVTGDSKSMRYVSRSSRDSVEFFINESIAIINGVSERTGANIVIVNGNVYIPLSFAQRCFNGLSINYSEKDNKIVIDKMLDAQGNFVGLSFPYKLPEMNTSINFGELNAVIQEYIINQNQPPQPDTPDNSDSITGSDAVTDQ